MVVDEREDLTVEERLVAAEKRIAFSNREVVSLGWGLFAVVAVAVIAVFGQRTVVLAPTPGAVEP